MERSQLRLREKKILEIMPAYDSLLIETKLIWDNPRITFIHFYKGQASVGSYFDACTFLALAAEKKLCAIDASITQYYDMFADTVLMEPMPKVLTDSIVPILSAIVRLTSDPEFIHCGLYAPNSDGNATITVQKALFANTAISECSFYALNKTPLYCQDNMKWQQIATIPMLFKKAYEPVSNIIQQKRTALVLKRFAELGKLPEE